MVVPKPPPRPAPKSFTNKPVGKTTKRAWLKPALQILVFLMGAVAVYALFASAPREKKLVCRNSVVGKGSLTAFGSCTKE